jgi:predicted nucleic acid-binding protein
MLIEHIKVPGKIHTLGIKTLPIDIDDILKSNEIKREFGLLTNDAITLAVMKRTISEILQQTIRISNESPTL